MCMLSVHTMQGMGLRYWVCCNALLNEHEQLQTKRFATLADALDVHLKTRSQYRRHSE